MSLLFDADTYTVNEGGSAASETVRLSSSAQANLSIRLTIATEGGASFEDYSGVPLQAGFASGKAAVTFDVVASDDTADD